MGSTTITPNQAKINLPKPGGQLPAGVPLPLDFTAHASYDIDLTIFQQQGNLGGASSAFFDNSAGAKPLIVKFSSGQTIQCPAKSQGYAPVVAPNPISLNASCADNTNASAMVILLNYTVPPGFWSVA